MSRAACVLLVLVAACARRQQMPIMASQLFAEGDGRHLSAYLRQRDASAAVCDLNARGPHLAAIDADARHDLVNGLSDGRITPPLWRECVDRLVRSADNEDAAALLDDVTRAYAKAITEKNLEGSNVAQQRLSALHDVLVGAPSEVSAHSAAMSRLAADVHDAIARKRLGPTGQRFATELIDDVELSHGVHDGRPIDTAMLDTLLQARDDSTLRRYALHLTDPALRSEARRRLIRLHIEQSPFEAVRRDSAGVENMLMTTGSNAISIAEHPVVRGWIDDSPTASPTVLVRQDVARQTGTLVGAVDAQKVSVLPQINLRGTLHLQVEGIARSITVCGAPDSLDVSPCVAASAVKLNSRFAYLEADGSIRFLEQLIAPEMRALAAGGERVVVPVIVSGQQVAALDWKLRFEKPNDIALGGGGDGQAGPELRVRVEQLPSGRLSYSVNGDHRRFAAIVERDQAIEFHVISYGGDGARGRAGSSGLDGSNGLSGSNASCPSTPATDGGRGGDGSAGDDGGPGEAGGDGGDIRVDVVTPGTPPDTLLALLQKTVLSRGGSGGDGGPGGTGGRGGMGGLAGSGATCVDSQGAVTVLPGGSQGSPGSDGRAGSNGTPGSSGQSGHVTVRVVE